MIVADGEAFPANPGTAARSSNSKRAGQPPMVVSPAEERPSRPAATKTDRCVDFVRLGPPRPPPVTM